VKRIKGIKILIVTRFKDYWLGTAPVCKHYIYGDWPEEKRLHTISIVPSLRRKGAWFKDIPGEQISKMVNTLCKKPKFQLHIDYGCGTYLEYIFNKYQQRILKKSLEDILRDEIVYIEK
jgi:hypothetical protein